MGELEKKYYTYCDWFVMGAFVISTFSSKLVLVLYFSLFLYCKERAAGGVKALFWITMRGFLNSEVAKGLGDTTKLKYGLLLFFSVFIILTADVPQLQKRKLNKIIVSSGIFSIAAAIFSFLNGSYPVVSMLKASLFCLPLCAVFTGIAATNDCVNWKKFFLITFGFFIVASALVFPFQRFRTTNDAFQGIFNHVNMCGIMFAMYLSVLVTQKSDRELNGARYAAIFMLLLLVYLTESRTSMLTCMAALLAHVLLNYNINKKVTVFFACAAALVIVYLNRNSITKVGQELTAFLYKNDAASIWESRLSLIDEEMIKFQANPLYGSGFLTPYDTSVRSYMFFTDKMVEPGNIIIALLGDTGIIGTILFSVFLITMYRCGNKSQIAIFVGAMIVNMGEVIFFSSNNAGIIQFFLLAMYVFPNAEDVPELEQALPESAQEHPTE